MDRGFGEGGVILLFIYYFCTKAEGDTILHRRWTCLSGGKQSLPSGAGKGRRKRHWVMVTGIRRHLSFPAQQVHSVYTTPHCISSLTQHFNIHFLVRRLGNRVHDLQDGLRIPQVDWLVGGISELQQAVSIMSVCFRYRCEMIWQSISKCVWVLGLFFSFFFFFPPFLVCQTLLIIQSSSVWLSIEKASPPYPPPVANLDESCIIQEI